MRSWKGHLRCLFARSACDNAIPEAHTVKPELDNAHSFGTTRSYWLHRKSTLFAGLLKLLKETGTQPYKLLRLECSRE